LEREMEMCAGDDDEEEEMGWLRWQDIYLYIVKVVKVVKAVLCLGVPRMHEYVDSGRCKCWKDGDGSQMQLI
jgi:hypothetical protein